MLTVKIIKRIWNSTKVQKIREFSVEFCENTSIHGFRYFVERERHWSERFWWIFSVCLSVALCSWSIQIIWMKWIENPVNMSFTEMESTISDIPFPTVTICPETKQSKSRFDLGKTMQKLKENGLESLTARENNQLKALIHLCEYVRRYTNYSDEFAADDWINDEIIKMALSINTLKECKWLQKPILRCEMFKPTILTENGLCWSFNALNSREMYTDQIAPEMMKVHNNPNVSQWNIETGYDKKPNGAEYPRRMFTTGKRTGLQVTLKMFMIDMNYWCQATVSGYKVILSMPGEELKMSEQSIRVSHWHDTHISIKPKMITTSDGLRKYAPNQRQCFYNSERQLRFYRNYAQNSCEAECLANFTNIECGCVKFSMPRDSNTKICGSLKIECYQVAQAEFYRERLVHESKPFRDECNCLPACFSIEYEKTESQLPIQQLAYIRSFLHEMFTMLTKVTIFYEKFEVETTQRVEMYTNTDFIAVCGGLLGLFLGISVLSVIEFIYYFTLRFIWNIRQSNELPNAVTSIG